MAERVIGDTVFEGADSSTTPKSSLYSPWFPRGGDAAVFTLEVISINGLTLTWVVETKNSEDANSAASTVGSAVTATTTGLKYTATLTGFEELVRFRYDTGSSASMDWVHFRALNPSWAYN